MPDAIDWGKALNKLAPDALPVVQAAYPSLPALFESARINTSMRQMYFIALALEETGGFVTLDENLHYSAKGLLATFPKYFTAAQATTYANNQEAIANRVYAGRMGNTSPGDGWKYHGRGPFQLTGRANYAQLGKLCQLPLEVQPELVNATRYLFVVAAQYWNMRNLSVFADTDDLISFTIAVNGGQIGLDARKVWLDKTKAVVNAQLAPAQA